MHGLTGGIGVNVYSRVRGERSLYLHLGRTWRRRFSRKGMGLVHRGVPLSRTVAYTLYCGLSVSLTATREL